MRNDMITCGFIGLGLIGGSIARALKKNRTDIRILVCDPNEETRRLSLSAHVADAVFETPTCALSECDYLFLCAPVAFNDANLQTVLPLLNDGCILTDVGSVKTPIYRRVQKLGLTNRFIGGHPMAGSERTGFLNSKAALLENAYYILTPGCDVPPDAIARFRELILSTGAIPLQIDSKEHDFVTAAVSHLPHIIAASLVNLVRSRDQNGLMKAIAAGGFKDITRIASSSPIMWQQICLTNTDNISELLRDYIACLQEIQRDLDSRDAKKLYCFFDEARRYRDSFIDANSGPIKKAYTVRATIADETGALAEVAALLAQNDISIKNIGISHNREVEEGTLIIEFYEETAVQRAVGLLTLHHYEINGIT